MGWRDIYPTAPFDFAKKGRPINLTPGDWTAGDEVTGVIVTSAGNVVLRPREGDTDITLTGMNAGLWLPYDLGIIRKTGTTAGLATTEF